MSNKMDFLGYSLVYPKLNILYIKENGERHLFDVDFLRYYFFASILVGAYYFSRKALNLFQGFKNIFRKFLPLKIKNKTIAVIFGYGDSIASVKVIKILIDYGYYPILLNTEKINERRRRFDMDYHDGMPNLDKLNCFISYEDLIRNPNIIKEKIGKLRVEFIFDFTYLNFLTEEEALNRKRFDVKKKKMKDREAEEHADNLINPTNIFDSSRKISDISSDYYFFIHDYSLYYSQIICDNLKYLMTTIELLLTNMMQTKVFFFKYNDVTNDLDNKILIDYKTNFFNTISNLIGRKGKFINFVKNIHGYKNFKLREFTEKDALDILIYNEIYHEFNFT